MPGDRLITVNGESMEGITKEHALRVLAQLKLKLDLVVYCHNSINSLCVDIMLKIMRSHMAEKKNYHQ